MKTYDDSGTEFEPIGTDSPDWTQIAEECRANLPADRKSQLAAELGVTVASLEALRTGWGQNHNAYTFPEYDENERVCGIGLRKPDGSKSFMKGGRRGLIIPNGWRDSPGPLLIVEGPSDVAAALTLGLNAIGRPFNRGGSRIIEKLLQRREVLVIGENDRKSNGTWPGRSGAEGLARDLASAWNGFICWALIPDEAKDLRKWFQLQQIDLADLDARHQLGRDLLGKLNDRAKTEDPDEDAVLRPSPTVADTIRLSDVQPEEVSWLWHDRIPSGKLTLIAGEPGLGKSFLTLDIAARVSTGRPFPDGSTPLLGTVILLSAEDGLADTIRPRLDCMEADPTRVVAIRGVRREGARDSRPFDLAHDLGTLRRTLADNPDTKLIVIDPVSAYMGNTNTHRDSAVRQVLGPLAAFAEESRVAIIAVTHLNKSQQSKAIYRSMGSVGFIAAARAAWLVCQSPDCPDTRLLIPMKNNLSKHVDGLSFQIREGAVNWLDDVVSQSADSLLFADSTSGPKHTALDVAKHFLAAILEEKPLPSKEVINLAEQEGMSERSLRRAKAELKIESKRLGFANGSVSFWVLPSHTWPMDPVHGQDSRLAEYGEVGQVCIQGTDSPASKFNGRAILDRHADRSDMR